MLRMLIFMVTLILFTTSVSAAVTYPSGCSQSPTDYTLVDSFDDTNGVTLNNHYPDYNDTAIITSSSWETASTQAQVQSNVAYGDNDGDRYEIAFTNSGGNYTYSTWAKQLDGGGSFTLLMESSDGKAVCQATIGATDDVPIFYGTNYNGQSFSGVVDTDDWNRYEITHDNDNDICNYYVYDNDETLLINYSANDKVDPLSSGDATRFGHSLTNTGGQTGYADNLTFYSGNTCPVTSDSILTSSETNWTSNMIDYTFGGILNTTGFCTLNGNWTGSMTQNATTSVTANTGFNITNISFSPTQTYGWYMNCSNLTGTSTTTSDTFTFTTNSIPNVTNINIKPASPETTNNLTCNYTYGDEQEHEEFVNYIRWYVNGTFNATGNTLHYSNTSTNDLWSCDVIVNDGGSNSSLLSSSNVTIGDTTIPSFYNFSTDKTSYFTSEQVNVTATCEDTGSSIAGVWYTYNLSGTLTTHEMTLKSGDTYSHLLSVPTANPAYIIQNFSCLDTSNNMVENLTDIQFAVTVAGAAGGTSPGGGGKSATPINVSGEILSLTCGNGVCDINENIANCQSDCKLNLDTILCFDTDNPECVATQFLVPNVLLGFLMVLGIFYLFRTQVQNKR